MDMSPNHFERGKQAGAPLRGAGRAQFGQGSANVMSLKWSALHEAAAIVGSLAGIASEPMRPDVRNFPSAVREAGGWRREAAEQGIEDISAILEPGLSALLTVHARGADPAAPALALWREFQAARDALLTLAPPGAR